MAKGESIIKISDKKRCTLIIISIFFIFIMIQNCAIAGDPIPSYKNNTLYPHAYSTNQNTGDDHYQNADKDDEDSFSTLSGYETYYYNPYAILFFNNTIQISFFTRPSTEDLLYFDLEKDIHIIIHGEFDESLLNFTVHLQHGPNMDEVVFGVDTEPEVNNPGYYEFYLRLNEEVIINDLHLVLLIKYEYTSKERFDFKIYTDGSSKVILPLIPPPDVNTTVDSDNDNIPDYEDEFPNDPDEWNDTDGDGVGDNGDAYPDDPDKWEIEDEKLEDGSSDINDNKNKDKGFLPTFEFIIVLLAIGIIILVNNRRIKKL